MPFSGLSQGSFPCTVAFLRLPNFPIVELLEEIKTYVNYSCSSLKIIDPCLALWTQVLARSFFLVSSATEAMVTVIEITSVARYKFVNIRAKGLQGTASLKKVFRSKVDVMAFPDVARILPCDAYFLGAFHTQGLKVEYIHAQASFLKEKLSEGHCFLEQRLDIGVAKTVYLMGILVKIIAAICRCFNLK
ncbi:hypothetical protein Peur_015839 [Populus x canadensis]